MVPILIRYLMPNNDIDFDKLEKDLIYTPTLQENQNQADFNEFFDL